MPYNSKNQCGAETIERYSINRIWMIEYNRLRLRIKVYKLINNGNRCSDRTFWIKHRSKLIIKLKTIQSWESTFCYVFFYLHCSFLWHLFIVTFIVLSGLRCRDSYTILKMFTSIQNICFCCCIISLSAAIKLSKIWVLAIRYRNIEPVIVQYSCPSCYHVYLNVVY